MATDASRMDAIQGKNSCHARHSHILAVTLVRHLFQIAGNLQKARANIDRLCTIITKAGWWIDNRSLPAKSILQGKF